MIGVTISWNCSGIPNALPGQKAKAFLDAHQISYTLRDIKLEAPTEEELKVWQTVSSLPLRKFFNSSGLVYRSLALKERLPDMPEEEQRKLLASDGMLVKRPVLVKEDLVLVGFRQKEWEEALLP